MKSNPPTHTIGDVASRFGLATHVLRHWEDCGLVRPARDAADRRRYADDDLVRIAVIVSSKAAGMSLEQIGVLLRDDHGPDRHRVLQEHLADLERRMKDMEISRAMTQHAFDCEAHDITRCPQFRSMVDDVVAGTRAFRPRP